MIKTMAVPSGPFQPTWDSLKQFKVPQWYQDGKFGIFIHWGLYSVPAYGNEWYPRNMYREDTAEFRHHLSTYGSQKQFGYKDFIPRFTAAQFDPDQWADIFHRAGAHFVVPVAEHHDGFAMYDTRFSDWCAAKMGPRRDLIGSLAESVRRQGMVFGVSYHRAEHWWFMNGGTTFDSDVRDGRYSAFYGPAAPDGSQPDEAYLENWLARLYEIIDKYHPQLFWFDWWIEQPVFEPYLRRFASYFYNRGVQWGQGVAINYKNKSFPEQAAILDLERGQLSDIRELFWQNDTSISKNSWGYVEKQEYKTAESIICDLVDIVSKNGALLLNIGPRPDGTIPETEEQILLDVGHWLDVNGEAIYGTRTWRIYGEGPTQVESGMFTDTKRASFTERDMRFTVNGDTLYVTVLAWPHGPTTIQSLSTNMRLYTSEIGDVQLIGAPAEVRWSRDAAGLHVQFPAQKPSNYAYVLKITPKR